MNHSHPPSITRSRYNGASSSQIDSVKSNTSYKTTIVDHMNKPHHGNSNKGKSGFISPNDVLGQSPESPDEKHVSDTDTEIITLSGISISESDIGSSTFLPKQVKEGISYCPSPQNSMYASTQYAEAKESFTNTELSGSGSSAERSGENDEIPNSEDLVESRKTSIYRESTGSDVSDESSSSSFTSTMYKPHKGNDTRWEAIKVIRSRDGLLGLNHFRLLKRLGCGDIGSVYLSELSGTRSYFAMKVMDKTALASRKKLLRAQTEREILECLDHPFLPTLYSHFETEKFSCVVMEFCPGGDLHVLRQKQPGKCFAENAARFYVAEVLLALEYLHMLGIIYRDLKPENVLVRDDGHIMLSDFDLSLRCTVSPTLVKSSNTLSQSKDTGYCIEPSCVIQPSCIQPGCFAPRFFSRSKKGKKETKTKTKSKSEIYNQVIPLPELMAEPTSARSMSFVGTHEYLAPEIIKGEGHGSAVDWWTFGIFLYELLFGKTPFKGQGNRATLFNVVGQPLRFPDHPAVSFAARDLIRGLLVKEPQHRLAYRRGATEIKQHPFFQSVNWALIRCTSPPDVPKPFVVDMSPRSDTSSSNNVQKSAAVGVPGVDVKPSGCRSVVWVGSTRSGSALMAEVYAPCNACLRANEQHYLLVVFESNNQALLSYCVKENDDVACEIPAIIADIWSLKKKM